MIRAGIDGRAFQSPAAGVRRYVWELAQAFARRGDVELTAIGAAPDDPLPPGVRRLPEPPSPPTNLGRHAVGLPLALARARARPGAAVVTGAGVAPGTGPESGAAGGLDLYHAPAYTAPCWGRMPLVVSLHDVSYARRPEWYPYRRDALRRAFYAWSARRARIILTISAFSREEIVAAYGVDPARVRVVPLGVGPAFAPATADAGAWLAGVRERPYLLHVGDLHERRNLLTALRALAAVRRRRPDLAQVRLVLAGVDRGVGAALREEAAALGAPDLIDLRGAVPDAELLTLYQQASLLVYPSRYEGFGFPVAEAMACGLPVAAARASALPEVVADAGLLLDPDDVEAWSAAIEAVLLDDGRAQALRASGLTRARGFSWDRTAEGTLDAYRSCLQAETVR